MGSKSSQQRWNLYCDLINFALIIHPQSVSVKIFNNYEALFQIEYVIKESTISLLFPLLLLYINIYVCLYLYICVCDSQFQVSSSFFFFSRSIRAFLHSTMRWYEASMKWLLPKFKAIYVINNTIKWKGNQ